MIDDSEMERFIRQIRERFPDAADRADQVMESRGYDPDEIASMPYLWLEALADITNESARNKEQKNIVDLTRYMAETYETGSEAVRRAIDTAYVENLMYDLNNDEKAWVCPLFPPIVRELYSDIWGKPRL